MRYLRAVLDPGAETTHPMHAFVAEREDLRDYRLVQWNPAGDGDVALVFHVRGDRAVYEAALTERVDPVTHVVMDGAGSSFHVYVRDELTAANRQLAGAFARAGLVVVPPVAYRDDLTIEVGVVGPNESLQAAVAAVPEKVDVEVRALRGADEALSPGARLTDRQHEALRAAVRRGYYETPRETTVAEVADELGCAPGTAAEHLRKVESKVLTQVVAETGGDAPGGR
jgi:predicted DNA binding protein